MRVARPALPPLERYSAALEQIWDSGRLSGGGQWAQMLEQRYGEHFGAGRAVLAAANGGLALTLAIAALELPRGARAVLPSLSYPSAVNAIEWNGLRPDFVDVDPADWCLHPEQLEAHIEGAALVLATHLFGAPCDGPDLERLARSAGAALVFDGAHALCSSIAGSHVACHGDAVVFSLNATKPAPTAEGGLAVFADEEAAARFALLRTSGIRADGLAAARGLNAKLSELHAALAVLSLEALPQELEARGVLLARHREHARALPGARLQQPLPGAVTTPSFMTLALPGRRERAIAALDAHGIEARSYFPALHLMPRFACGRALPVCERLGDELLTLPLYAGMPPSLLEELWEVLADVAGAASASEG